MYVLHSISPRGVEKESFPRSTKKLAAAVAAYTLYFSEGLSKKVASQFATTVEGAPLGTKCEHPSGYVFWIQEED